MPGPPPIPLLGEIFNVMRKGLYANDMDLVQKYGKTIGIFEGTTPAILLSDPDLLRNVLIKDSHVFINRRTMGGVTGIMEHGLTALKDEQWKNARSIVSPTFSTAKLKAVYIWCFVNLLNLLEKMSSEKDKIISILKAYHDQMKITVDKLFDDYNKKLQLELITKQFGNQFGQIKGIQ